MQNYKKALFALALSAFCMGVTEFVMAGVLVDVEAYFGVDAKTAGYLTTLYAIGVVIGAPLITIPLSRFHRHIQLLINLGIFALANFIIFLAKISILQHLLVLSQEHNMECFSSLLL